MEDKKIGFTIGKFAPLHKGHQYLIETALKEVDELYVVIYKTDVTDIPIDVRANWIKRIYPSVNIIYALNPPKQYGLDIQSTNIQNSYLKSVLGDIKPTHFFSSEKYGEFVAKYFDVVDRRVDNNRKYIDITATKIRSDLGIYRDYLENGVYDDCLNFKNLL